MRTKLLVAAAAAVGLVVSVRTQAKGEGEHEQGAPMNAKELKWGPAPPAFPPGAQAVVLQGDPSVAGQEFTVRLRAKKGYTIPPHFHPTDEHVTVIQGKLYLGMGDQVDKKSGKLLQPGGFATAAKDMHHWAMAASDDVIVQVHAMGPFEITYVHPGDDPRARAAEPSQQQGNRAGRPTPATNR